MRITKVNLNNYVCFYDEYAEDVELGPGINFIIGKNNSGKTALLDVLSHEGKGEPHRSEVTTNHLYPGLSPQQTQYEIAYQFDRYELLRILFADKDYFFYPQAPRDRRNAHLQPWGMPSGFLTDTVDNMRYQYKSNVARLVRLGNSIPVFSVSGEHDLNCYRAIAAGGSRGDSFNVSWTMPDRVTHMVNTQETSWAEVARRIPQYVYRFLAERRISAVAPVEEETRLKSDASNLSSLLNVLSASRLQTYLNSVQSIMPEIKDFLFKPGNGTVELMLSYDIAREDLAVSLDECGTGVGQILAMLYVSLFYDKSKPRVLIIDEPYSFLHPGAVRKLLEIFQEHDHHQYIIATHSPTAIMSVKKKHILLVTRESQVSSVKSIKVNDNTELEAALVELGTKRSDIFGMDAYIWVEGKTDKICFDLIMDKHGGLPSGVEIIDLVHTGDFNDKRRGALIEQIYARLSGSVGILPSVLAFVFDGDLQNDEFKETGTRKFLPRQNYESYLIAPAILADILNRDAADDKPKDHTADSVKKWIRDKESKDYDDPEWLESVDGAKLLNTMFQDLAGISYKGNKAQYGEDITRRILESNKDHFHEIVDLIKGILEKE